MPRLEAQTVLDVVTYIQRVIDPTLSYRFACRVGVCGSCAMNVNGKARWTCRTHVEKVTADGTLASVQLPLAAAPAGVQKTISEHSGFLVRLEQIFEDGESTFEAVLRVKGKAVLLELKADGSKL